MSGHTPGPWRIEWGEEHESDRVYGIRSADGTLIVETDTGIYPPTADDARLIAAAPAMLDLLHRSYDNPNMGCPECSHLLIELMRLGPEARALLKEIDA